MGRKGAVIQARTSSTRLPRKILLPLPYSGDTTVLQQVIRRTLKAKSIDTVIVATTTDKEDDVVVEIAESEGVLCFRGSRKDVLSRYYYCAEEYELDTVVRITSDCPCIDWDLIDKAVSAHIKEKADYTRLVDIPLGLNVEVVERGSLQKAYEEAKEHFEREHVTPYIYMRGRKSFRIEELRIDFLSKYKNLRITLDTEEDYALLCAVFEFLYPEKKFFNAYDIVDLFERKPWLVLINKRVYQKKVFGSLEEEIEEAKRVLEFHGLDRAKEMLER